MMEPVCRQRSEKTGDAADNGCEDDRSSAETVAGIGTVETEHDECTGCRAADSAHRPAPKKRMVRNEEIEGQQRDEPSSEDKRGRIDRNECRAREPLIWNRGI